MQAEQGNGPQKNCRLVGLYHAPDISLRITDPRLSLPDIDSCFQVQIAGATHELSVRRLSPPRAITVKYDLHFLCDCHDLTLRPVTYRPHMYTGVFGETSFDERLKRMTKFQEALLVFDAAMTAPPSDSLQVVKQVLAERRLPRAELVVLSTSRPTLQKLYISMGAVERGDLLLEWDTLIQFARSGELVTRWLELKSKAK